MKVGWFSCGCSSLVACKLAEPDETIYIHVANQHPDSIRFLADARQVLGEITVLQSNQFISVDEVISLGYINGAGGGSMYPSPEKVGAPRMGAQAL